jgi:hypothetical protein
MRAYLSCVLKRPRVFPGTARTRQNQPVTDNYLAITGNTRWALQNLSVCDTRPARYLVTNLAF